MNYVFYLRSEISSLLLAVATAREAKHLNSSQDTSPYRFTLKFEVKFINLTPSKFTKLATLCVSKAMSPHLTCSGVGEGMGEEGATLRK